MMPFLSFFLDLLRSINMSTEPPGSPLEPAAQPGGTPHDPDATYRLASPSPMVIDPLSAPVLVNPRPVKKAAKKSRSTDFWALTGYNALVFVTSICVMTLELTASRLIAKTVGSSLYTWTSVIGVVLAGITLGNFLGGWLADRYDRVKALAWMYLFGSVSCASVLWMDQLVAPMARPSMISWPTWVLTVVAVMFMLPSLALGTISPLVASMALTRSSRLGTTVGNVYAWGALGSIIGTFLTGFYLMDVWGTRTIIGLTAGTLGLLAVIVSGVPRLFRTAVVCGWLQLLGWTVLAATCTQDAMGSVIEAVGTLTTVSQSRLQAEQTRANWKSFGISLGAKVHELGLVLRLRDDHLGTYYDESSYSTIMVTDGVVNDREHQSRPVKYLRLDKLIHSYYDPANPTALYYEYEKVYAAVTKRTAELLTQPVTVSTTSFPGEIDVARLPAGVTYDSAQSTLQISQPGSTVFDALLALAPEGGYWKVVEKLNKDTSKPLWGGFAAEPLEQLPEGVTIPEELNTQVRYDRALEVLTAYDVVTDRIRDQLIASTPHAAWHNEIQRARGLSRRATGLFMGGGGFIFPRWFLKEFPGSPRIEVAELDPAVYTAVVKALGLTDLEQQRILTVIGDARNFVDDRLRENLQLAAAGKSPVKYDFIYGDAFNDFSIPAHLTTREFLQKVHALLSDDGVFQANIIDIYPRVEYPGTTVGEGEVTYRGPLPRSLAGREMTFGRYESVGSRFDPLEIKSFGNGEYRIRSRRTISSTEQRRLTNVDMADEFSTGQDSDAKNPAALTWSLVIDDLATQTRQRKWFEGSIPTSVMAGEGNLEAWTPARPPWESLEFYRIGNNGQQGRYVMGIRGILPAAMENQLIGLDPNNKDWVEAIRASAISSRKPGAGRFMGRYVATAADVFPNLYIYSTSNSHPGGDRDTFVMVCSRRPLDLRDLSTTGDWSGDWFAARETRQGETRPVNLGQMASLLSLSEGQLLTDDFAPVDNLLGPVFADQQ